MRDIKDISGTCPICKAKKLYNFYQVTSRCPFTDQIESARSVVSCKKCDMEVPLISWELYKNIKRRNVNVRNN